MVHWVIKNVLGWPQQQC
ncbi:hypothetical protein Goari_022987 [Gossypium aridum]|uniref:Uncharacterized protein n=1 Tax=Gossypium aridum TaxID=34290 RepID=A0A7J8YP74_GOSAI|nr:hypothetical protein [Gossypium aridum]